MDHYSQFNVLCSLFGLLEFCVRLYVFLYPPKLVKKKNTSVGTHSLASNMQMNCVYGVSSIIIDY